MVETPTTLHVVHGVLSLDVGGLERVVLSLVRAARQRQHRVSIVCVERPGRLAPEAEAEGARVLSLDKPAGRLPEYVRKAADAIAELNADILHTHQIGAAWYLGQATRTLGLPVVHTEHGNAIARATTIWSALKSRAFFHRTGRWIDRCCCVSQEIADTLTRWGTLPRAKVEVIPNGIDTTKNDEDGDGTTVREELGIPHARRWSARLAD